MNNLINKAIQAIKDNKADYAIGLLEGAVEMNDQNAKNEDIAIDTSATKNPLIKPFFDDKSSTNVDPSVALDALAKARIEDLKKNANIETA